MKRITLIYKKLKFTYSLILCLIIIILFSCNNHSNNSSVKDSAGNVVITQEENDYNNAMASDSLALFRNFLKKYPNSTYRQSVVNLIVSFPRIVLSALHNDNKIFYEKSYFDDYGKIIIKEKWSSDDINNLTKISYKYDSSNKLIEEVEQTYWGNTRIEYIHDKSISKTSKYRTYFDGQRELWEEIFYTQNGLKSKSLFKNSKIDYSYDDNFYEIKRTFYENGNKEWELEMKYNDKGNLISGFLYNSDESLRYKEEYVYSNGMLSKIIQTDNSGNKTTQINYYDKFNKNILKYEVHENGLLTFFETFQIEYQTCNEVPQNKIKSDEERKDKAIKNVKPALENKAGSVKLSKNLSEIRKRQINIIIPKLESMSLNDVLFFEKVYNCVDIMQHVGLLEYMQSNPNYKNEIQKFNYGNKTEYDIGAFSQFFNSNKEMQKFGEKAY